MKVIYIAADPTLPRSIISNMISHIVRDSFDSDCANGFFFSPKIGYQNGQVSVSSDDIEKAMQFARQFNEIWLLGHEEFSTEFDKRFPYEVQAANADPDRPIPIRHFTYKS